MRQNHRRVMLSAAMVAAGLTFPASASATSLAYLDAKEVWVANTDGSSKTRLSGGEGDWTAVSQNPQGWIVGVQNEAGKIADLSRFTVWNPQGTVQYRGPLARGQAGASYAYPLGINVTASGGAIIYGYSAYTAFPASSLQKGFYVLPSSTVVTPTLGPLSVSSAQFVSLAAGDRVVGTLNETTIGVQSAESIGSTDFVPWLSVGNLPNHSYLTLDTSDDGKIVIAEVDEETGGGNDVQRINVTRTEGLGLPYVDDCFLGVPTADEPEYPTVSPTGDLIAWTDKGGVKLTAVPNLRPAGPPTCELPSPVATISATGSYPSLGGFDLAGYLARIAGP
ncbi:MAG: hypothetical protein Q7T55_14435, partial [Solirubrobacteraceae bacterium]|nr:hypothetical protein [Solirubrobacteraceae bacterium]